MCHRLVADFWVFDLTGQGCSGLLIGSGEPMGLSRLGPVGVWQSFLSAWGMGILEDLALLRPLLDSMNISIL